MAGTRNERGERAEERHEARDDDGEPAVFGKEMVELAHAFRRERFHFAGIDDAHAEEPRDPVFDVLPKIAAT